MKKQKKKTVLLDYALLVVGAFIAGGALNLFLVPAKVVAGGATGLGTILYHTLGLSVGLVNILVNLPLFALGYREVGKELFWRSILATLLLSAATYLIPEVALSQNAMLSSVYGGAAMGLGLGLVMRGGATTGGSELAALLLHKLIPQLKVTGWIFVIDAVIILAAGIIFDAEMALYAILALFLTTKTIDLVQEGLDSGKVCYIISDQSRKIAQLLMEELERGVTLLSARGMYSGEEKEVLLCVVTRMQLVRLKRIVTRVDPEAFVILSNAHEVLGEGFKPHVLK